ncbi:MAG: Fur family transcriptional regulator [Gammaproteobacteria bacterium]|jgi:Fur family iron response transcriptional regulator
MSQTVPVAILTEEQAAEQLRKYDILPTQQRLQIAQVLLTRDQHVSAERVLEMANAGGYSVSKATVYNTLGLFAEKGIVREVIVDPTRVFYDTNSSSHHHFYNIDTGELSDIDTGSLPVEQLPAVPPGTVLEGVDIVIRVRKAERPET